jgi:predicted nucleic acid-binding Zn ribbon protein
MHCTNCGAAVANDVKYCAKCGSAVGNQKTYAGLPVGKWILAGVLLLVGVAITSQDWTSNSSSSFDTGSTTALSSDRPTVHVSTIAEAQRASRDLINEAGHSCGAVTSISPIGSIESGGTVHRANCTNGEQYAVILSDDDQLRFLSSCAVFTASTGERC